MAEGKKMHGELRPFPSRTGEAFAVTGDIVEEILVIRIHVGRFTVELTGDQVPDRLAARIAAHLKAGGGEKLPPPKTPVPNSGVQLRKDETAEAAQAKEE